MKTTIATPDATSAPLEWLTSKPQNATHVIDDGGCIYWAIAPGMSSDEVGGAFRIGYDGALGAFDITDVSTGEATELSA